MAQKTYAQLAAQTTVVDADLFAVYRGTGPLKRITALQVVNSYLDTFYVRQDGTKPFTAVAPVIVAGAESLPGLAFQAEPSMGMWRPSSGVLAWSTAGVERARLSSAGLTLASPLAVAQGGTGAVTSASAAINLGLEVGVDVQAYDADLSALAANSTNGFWARTGAGTGAARTLTGTANEITVANGDGSGVPTLSLPAALTFTGKTVTGGLFAGGAFNGTLGATTPAAGTFTTLSTTGSVVLGDAASDSVIINAKSVTAPNLPSFIARLSATVSDVTGDGTQYTVPWDTEVVDRGGDFNAGTFTAPVTGLYRLSVFLALKDVTTAVNDIRLLISTSNRDYTWYGGAGTPDAQTLQSVSFSTLADMDALDTAVIKIRVGGITKVVDIVADNATSPASSFSGELVA